MKRFAAAALCAGLLSACTITHEYPSTWSDVVPGGGCRAIAGVFQNRAEAGEKFDPAAISLAGFFFARNDPAFPREMRADRVEISYTDVLTVRAYDGSELVGTSHGLYGDDARFECDGDGAVAEKTGMTGGKSPVAGIQSETVALRMAKDGSLTVKVTGNTTGLVFMLLPMSGGEARWLRYRPWRAS